MEPFIYAFKTPRKFYFYDVNRDEIVNVSKNIYLFLNKAISHEDLDPSDKNEINFLIEQGYLSANRVKNIKHPETDDVEFNVKNRASELVLQVTQICNLCCSYCAYADNNHGIYQRKHSDKTMPWEIAKKAIDDFLDNSVENENVYFGFYGGEPFAAFPVIKKSIEYIEEAFTGKKIHYSITTNGTLLNDEMLDFVVSHKVRMNFSIDGPKSIHDVNRTRADGSGSFDAAFSNLKKVIEAYGDEYKKYINISMVIHPKNDIDEVEKFFESDLYRQYRFSVRAAIASDSKRDEAFEKRDDFERKTIYKGFLALADYFKLVKGLEISPVAASYMDSRLKNESMFMSPKKLLGETGAPGGPCVPGMRKVFVDVHGSYYPCERVSENLENMKIGSVYDGVIPERSVKLLNFAEKTADICRNCVAFRYCGLCAAYVNKDDDFSYDSKKAGCENARKAFKNTLKFLALKQEYINEYRKEISW